MPAHKLLDCDEHQRRPSNTAVNFCGSAAASKGRGAAPTMITSPNYFARELLNTSARVADCLVSGTGTGQMHISERLPLRPPPNRRTRREANPKGAHLHCGRPLSAGRCNIYDDRQADCQLDRQACAAETITGLDQVFAALSVSRLVLRTVDRARAGQTHCSLSGSYGPISERNPDFYFRRTSEARVGGETIQPHTGKVDEDTHLREAL